MVAISKKLFGICFLLLLAVVLRAQPGSQQWTAEKANRWYAAQPWLVGANFLPSTAINQLEMWQEASFDTATIARELGWAAGLGMNVMRVYLHDLAWKADPAGFKNRMDRFLQIASSKKIRPLFVFFDDCWNPDAKIGTQPAPKPGIHNSGWVRSPALSVHNDSTQWGYLKEYVTDVLTRFANDSRILMWDLYNEPGNSGYNLSTLPLLEKIFSWAWTVRPSQPLTCGTWYDNKTFNDFQLAHSDVITFHNYNDGASLEKEIEAKKKLGRPLICTEYMARTRGSRFQTHLPIFKKNKVGAINWGLVAGKSNTIYQWDTPIPDGAEPAVWFHDIFRKDGTPYDKAETDFIRTVTGGQ
ncbi:MAG: glycoside hydrolase family 2 TIM barrel-domain containing protein [Chitinophagaceae bacterium]